jgi:hypothetical protein
LHAVVDAVVDANEAFYTNAAAREPSDPVRFYKTAHLHAPFVAFLTSRKGRKFASGVARSVRGLERQLARASVP